MSPLVSILVFAALFAAFGMVRRERGHRWCDSCAPDARDPACSTCPFHEVAHD